MMDISHKLEINANAETVYTACATERGIKGWWSKDCKVGENVGEKSTLRFDKQGNIVEMGFRTDVLEPNKKVVWTCISNPNPAWIDTKIDISIHKKDDGVSVDFIHADFNEKWKGQQPFEMTKEGWEHFVNSLKSYCETGPGQPW